MMTSVTMAFWSLTVSYHDLSALEPINKPYRFTNGQVADANQVNSNFDILYNQSNAMLTGIAPVGVVLPWHKSVGGGELRLANGWVECNGQILNDSESPLNGKTIPDLNGVTPLHGGKGLFIRGGTSSGIYQNQQLLEHSHNDQGHAHTILPNNIGSYGPGGTDSTQMEDQLPLQQAMRV